jgi:hypothetical protein
VKKIGDIFNILPEQQQPASSILLFSRIIGSGYVNNVPGFDPLF